MALKTFNVDEAIYKKYSSHCKKAGISMSKQVERFIAEQLATLDRSSPLVVSQHAQPLELPSNTHTHEHSMKRFC